MTTFTWVKRGTAIIAVRKRVPLQGGGTGFTTEPDGTKSAEVVLEIDADAVLQELGRRALASKGKKSAVMSGAVRVRVVGTITHNPGAK